jgi:hypothetical protein
VRVRIHRDNMLLVLFVLQLAVTIVLRRSSVYIHHNTTTPLTTFTVPLPLLPHPPPVLTSGLVFRNSTNKMSSPDAFEHAETTRPAAISAAHMAPHMTSSSGDDDTDSRARAQSSALIVAKTATTSTYPPPASALRMILCSVVFCLLLCLKV